MRRRRSALALVVLLSFGLPFAMAQAQGREREEAQAERRLRLTFVGDIMGHDVNYRMEDFRDIYRSLRDALLAADLSFANLEFPLDPFRPAAGYPYFNGTSDYLAAALDSGFNLLSTANNHAFDGGEEGILQTIRALEKARRGSTRPFAWSGTRGNPYRPFGPETLLVNGVRVGFVAAAQFLNERDQDRYVHVVDYSNAAQVEEFLQFVRAASPLYDLFIVSYHGDHEYVQTPSPAKRAFFRDLLGSGAHVVVGHHPHVVQGYDIVEVNGTSRIAMYSMGNFISGMTWSLGPSQLQGMAAATGESYMLDVNLACGARGCTVTGADPIPIANYMNERAQMVVARLSDLADGAVKVTPAWRSYYAGRLALMKSFLARYGSRSPARHSAALSAPARSGSVP